MRVILFLCLSCSDISSLYLIQSIVYRHIARTSFNRLSWTWIMQGNIQETLDFKYIEFKFNSNGSQIVKFLDKEGSIIEKVPE